MGIFDSFSNSSSSEAILDNFWLFTEIFVYISMWWSELREREKERERKRANDTLTSACFISLTRCCVTSSANQALYLLAINYLVGLLTIFHRG